MAGEFTATEQEESCDSIRNFWFDPRSWRRRRISIRSLLMVCYSALMVIAVGLVFFFNFGAATKNTLSLQAELANGFVEGAALHVEAEKTPLEAQAAWLSLGFADGSLSFDKPDDLALVMSGALAGTPTLDFIGIVGPNGKGLVVDASTGLPEPLSIEDFADVKLPFESAMNVERAMWLPPIEWQGRVYLSYVTPLYSSGERVAVLFQSKTLEGVANRLLRNISMEGVGHSFILYGRERVLSHQGLDGQYGMGLETAIPLLKNFTGSPALSGFADLRPARVPNALRHPGYDIGVVDDAAGDEYFFIYKDIHGFSDKRLTVGMYFGDEDDNAEMERLGKSLAGSLLVLLIAVALTIKVSAWTAKPISALSEASMRIGRGDYDQVGRLKHSHLLELDEAAGAFNNMVKGIRERQKAMELFGRVVPISVAERMLRADGGLEPVSTEGTILFVDLQGFTSLAEKMRPQDVVTILNEYFTDMVAIVEHHNGIITQFQGDAILAVFNVPIADPQHAANAINAARAMQETLAGKLYDGYRLQCRIGVNTGPFIAGNVGAQSRMNYTVHGDAVNIAARLEQMNKEVGSTILASAFTIEAAGEQQASLVKNVTLRGRSTEIAVYQL